MKWQYNFSRTCSSRKKLRVHRTRYYLQMRGSVLTVWNHLSIYRAWECQRRSLGSHHGWGWWSTEVLSQGRALLFRLSFWYYLTLLCHTFPKVLLYYLRAYMTLRPIKACFRLSEKRFCMLCYWNLNHIFPYQRYIWEQSNYCLRSVLTESFLMVCSHCSG